MLTPAFHFRILEDFLDVMNKQSSIMCNILEPLAGGKVFDIFPLVTHCALDIICETAMGKSIGAQANSGTDYVTALYAASDIIFQRQKSPWLWDDRIFAITPGGFQWRKGLRTLHGYTNKVIAERKEEKRVMNDKERKKEDDVGVKKRYAFLDLLLEASDGGKVLSDEDIREEVDTFMFEGIVNMIMDNCVVHSFVKGTTPQRQACHSPSTSWQHIQTSRGSVGKSWRSSLKEIRRDTPPLRTWPA